MSRICRILLVSAVILFGSCLISKSCCSQKAATRAEPVASKLQRKVILGLEKIEERFFTGAEKNNEL